MKFDYFAPEPINFNKRKKNANNNIIDITLIYCYFLLDAYRFGHDYYYKAVIDLKNSIMPNHPLKPVEHWKLSDIGLNRTDMDKLRKQLDLI